MLVLINLRGSRGGGSDEALLDLLGGLAVLSQRRSESLGHAKASEGLCPARVALVASWLGAVFVCASLVLHQPVLGNQDLVSGTHLADGVRWQVNAPKRALCTLQL